MTGLFKHKAAWLPWPLPEWTLCNPQEHAVLPQPEQPAGKSHICFGRISGELPPAPCSQLNGKQQCVLKQCRPNGAGHYLNYINMCVTLMPLA